MARRKRKAEHENPFAILEDFAETVDALFLRYSGKTLGAWLKEPPGRPKELPQGEKIAVPAESGMPLSDAYAIMGLHEGASPGEVKRNYRHLANLFHPDKGGNREAMSLLNRAYERVLKEKGIR